MVTMEHPDPGNTVAMLCWVQVGGSMASTGSGGEAAMGSASPQQCRDVLGGEPDFNGQRNVHRL